MTRANSDEFQPLRALLSRHPAAVEAAHVAASLVPALCQFVTFESSWAYIVAASGGEVLQPRRLVASEIALLDETDDPYTLAEDKLADDEIRAFAGKPSTPGKPGEVLPSTSLPVVDATGSLVGALTIHGQVPTGRLRSLKSLARVVSGLITAHDFSGTAVNSGALDPSHIADSLRDAIFVVDSDYTIVWANDACGSLLARSRVDLIGQNATDLVHPDDLHIALDAISRIVAGSRVDRMLVRLRLGDGGWGQVEVTGTDQSSNPNINGVVMSLRSAELELEVEQDRQRSRHMSQALVERLHDGVVATDAVGAVTLVNRAAFQLFGIDESTPPGRLTWRDFPLLDRHANVTDRDNHPLRLLFGAQVEPSQEMSIASRSGVHRYVTVDHKAVTADDGSTLGSFVTFHDTTATREAQNELVSQALHDQLTGLPNRRMLGERLSELRDGGTNEAKEGTTLAACFLDLDAFKTVNDTHGHGVGDQMIRIAAERLSSQLREGDLLIRQGGDEFVALLVDVISHEAAITAAERLRAALSLPFIIDEIKFDVTASAGVAVAPLATVDEQDLLRQADIALYAAKARGRNRTELFDEALEMATEVEERQRRMLRYALDNDGIVMHFQPLIDSTTKEVHGFEALARCLDEQGVLHGPSEFLDSVAGSGLVWELDQQAFKLSCAAAAMIASVSDKTPTISCNFSPVSIVQPDFVDFISVTADRAGVPPGGLCIEITESAAFAGGKTTLDAVTELNELGFLFALDDFGTGYSSLSHLRDLPLSSVKVDRSFVAKLTDESSERAIAEAVVGLANDLGLGIVAEGVEDQEQLSAAQKLGFEVIQGWHYAAAMPLDEILASWIDRTVDARRN